MKKNKITLILAITLLICIIPVWFLSRREKDHHVDIKNETENKLESVLKKSPYFKDSKIYMDKEKEMLVIDERYYVTTKSGYYMMNIREEKNEEGYCQIVDAIETDLGYSVGKSIETCEKTLEGSIALGGISVENYDTYKILTVNSENPATLYDIERTRGEAELISNDEINYNIEIDNYLFTSMSTSYTENIKDFAVCGHVYNPKNKERDFTLKIYDENKIQIGEKILNYKNDKKKYLSFCTNFELPKSASYFSIEAKK